MSETDPVQPDSAPEPSAGATSGQAASPLAPSAAPPVPSSATPTHTTAQKKSGCGRGCLWAIIIVLVAILVMGAVIVPIALVAIGAGGGTSIGFGTGNIALIRIGGVIAASQDSGGLLAGQATTPESILKQIKNADDSSEVKVILIRINSPGGSASAGEEIAEAVKKAKKPVVVSIADEGASAAYMIASQSDHIVATPASLVGSIGVILEIPNYEGLFAKLGLKQVTLHEGKFKDIGNPLRPVTRAERAFLQGQLKEIYEQFIALVAQGRKMPTDKVRSLATGLFWNGTEAKSLGLVDEIGNYDDAVEAAARIGHITGKRRVVEMQQPSLIDVLSQSVSSTMRGTLSQAAGLADTGPRTR